MNFQIIAQETHLDPLSLFGSLGALLLLIAFGLNQTHIWNEDAIIYDLTNFFGGLILVIYAALISSFPFMILNAVWTLVSLRDLISGLAKHRS